MDPLEVPYTAEEKAIHAALKKYSKLRKDNMADDTEKMATEFVLMTLKKRLVLQPCRLRCYPGPARKVASARQASEDHHREALDRHPSAANRPGGGGIRRRFGCGRGRMTTPWTRPPAFSASRPPRNWPC